MIDQEDLLRRLQAIRAAQATHNGIGTGQGIPDQPPQPAPRVPTYAPQEPVVSAGGEDPRLRQAADLERQAAPPARPQGFRQNLVAGLGAGLEAFANPHGYQQVNIQRQEMERQRENDLVGRAKQLRGESTQDEQFRQTQTRLDQQQADTAKYQNASLEQVKRARDLDEQESKQDKFTDGPAGIYGIKTGNLKTPAPAKAPNLSNFSKETVNYKGQPTDVLVDLDPASTNKGKTFLQTQTGLQDITGQTQHYEAPAKYGEPLVPIYDPNKGANIYAQRSDATGAVVAQPTATLKEGRDVENSARKIESLRAAYSPNFVGPAAGRYYNAKALLPGTTLPEGYGTFMQLQADLKNSVIKLITGAQMGREEADRILKQVPTETDKPEIWTAKMDQTEKNIQFMQSLLDRQQGKSGTEAPPNPGSGGTKRTRIKF